MNLILSYDQIADSHEKCQKKCEYCNQFIVERKQWLGETEQQLQRN